MAFDLPAPPLPPQPVDVPWPTQTWPEGEAAAALTPLIDEAFDPDGALVETRAVIAVHHGRIVAERYGGTTDAWGDDGDPVTADTTLISWSMAKSMLHAVIGMLVADGRIDLTRPVGVPAWAADDRRAITIADCLRMRDGLDFLEDYDPVTGRSDVIEMLFGSGADDVAAFAEGRPLAHAPGSAYNYSSGTSNILSNVVKQALGGAEAQRAFLHDRLFHPIGMTSAIPRLDAAGTWIASSYVYATARDMARFGYLYLRDGVWDDDRILPAGWVDNAREAHSLDPDNGQYYGHHWWLTGDEFGTFWCSGFEGQQINVVPALDLVLVRLGKSSLEQAPAIRSWRDRAIQTFA